MAGASGGSSNDAAFPQKIQLNTPRPVSSPAEITIRVAGKSGPAGVQFARRANPQEPDSIGPFEDIRLAAGSRTLDAVPQDVDYSPVLWDFAHDLDGESFHQGIVLRLLVDGNALDSGALTLGNDAPRALSISVQEPPQGTLTGLVEITLSAQDFDPLGLFVEFNAAPGFPDEAWAPAHDAGSPADQLPVEGEPSIAGYVDAVPVTFVWNSAIDLPGEGDVLLRVRAEDAFGGRETLVLGDSIPFDNNAAPLAILREGGLVTQPARRRRIAIPFDLLDAEGDSAKVVIQWRREGEDFPDLASGGIDLTDGAQVASLLRDPAQAAARRNLHVCTPAPQALEGSIDRPLGGQDPDRAVRVPELRSGLAGAFRESLVGQTLEVLRKGLVPVPLALNAGVVGDPVAALPMPDGTSAWVLDRRGSSWVLEVVDLATGDLRSGELVHSGSGTPRALAASSDRRFALVATDAIITILERASSVSREFVNPFADGPRAMATRDGSSVWMSGDASVKRADLRPEAILVHDVLIGLDRPFGLALDPLDTELFFVAERGADRILEVSGSAMEVSVVDAVSDPGEPVPLNPPLPSPGALAFDANGTELLVICQEGAGPASLRALDRRQHSDLPRGRWVNEITRDLADPLGHLATGLDRLVLLTQPLARELRVGGGVEQRREIETRDGDTLVVTEPFAPEPKQHSRCRILDRLNLARATESGVAHVFVWDERDWEGGGEILFRVLCADTSLGRSGETSITTVAQALYSANDEQVLGSAGSSCPVSKVRAVAVDDIHSDGDLDLIAAIDPGGTGGKVVIYEQSVGSFESCRRVVLEPFATPLDNPSDLEIANLNPIGFSPGGDDLNDLIVTSRDNGRVAVFLNGSSGLQVSQYLVATRPTAVKLVDLTGDGLRDLLVLQQPGTVGPGIRMWVANGDGSFQVPGTDLASVSERGRALASGDIDSDGLDDLVVAHGSDSSQPDGTVKIYRQRPDHTFELLMTSDASVVEPQDVALADLDGDGALDAISANESSQDLAVFFQRDGSFDAHPSLTLGGPSTTKGATAIEVADINHDGLLDLVSANTDQDFGDDGTLTAFLQLAQGRFDPIPLVIRRTGFRPIALALGDVEHDGDLDLVAGTTAGLSFFTGRSPRDFDATPHQTLLFEEDASPRFVAAGDLDSDGDVDLVTSMLDADKVGLYFQESVGRFSPVPRKTLGDGMITNHPRHALLADVNDDGRLDLLSAQGHQDESDTPPFGPAAIALFHQRPVSGEFDAPVTVASSSVLLEALFLAVGDVNLDGKLDLVSADGKAADVALFLQGASGFPATPSRRFLGLQDPHAVDLADVDSDGNLDVLIADFTAHRLVVRHQDVQGGGVFSNPAKTISSTALGQPSSVLGTDIDLDGTFELVSANVGTDNLTVFHQILGEFDPNPLSLAGLDDPVLAIVGDLDRDGLPDLASNCELTVSSFPTQVVVFEQRSPGRFKPAPRLIGPQGTDEFVQGLCFADLDGNGELDLVSANLAGDKLWLFFSSR